jgi:hypothetical protein
MTILADELVPTTPVGLQAAQYPAGSPSLCQQPAAEVVQPISTYQQATNPPGNHP